MENKHICEFCESTNVTVENNCNCIVDDVICNDCKKVSYVIREDLQDTSTDFDQLLSITEINKNNMKEFRKIISESIGLQTTKNQFTEEERNKLFDDLMEMIKESDKKGEKDVI